MNFNQIFNDNKKMVYNLALQYCQNTFDAEEITQDVFIKIHNNMSKFNQESNVKTWIYRITINLCLDYIKAKKRRKRWVFANLLNIEDAPQNIYSDFNHPGVILEQKEKVEHIFSLINQLPDKQKTVVILLKIESLSMVEVSDIMGKSPKAIESLFQRAKTNLEILFIKTKKNEK